MAGWYAITPQFRGDGGIVCFFPMDICRTVKDLKNEIRRLSVSGVRPGFVPTMGALHKGHMALIDRCTEENEVTVCSIFVNPGQFNNQSDYKSYPRTEEADCILLEKHRCTIAFIPPAGEVYPGDENPSFEFGPLVAVMEGRHRPGHFAGMAAVVHRLFNIVQPGRAYFGEKDFQQLAVIKSLVRQQNHKIQIVACPTVRESDGLAMSSRNIRLTPGERKAAPVIYDSLQAAAGYFEERVPAATIEKRIKSMIEKEGLFRLEYFEIAEEDSLQPIDMPDRSLKCRAFIAVLASQTRLIDNLALP